MTTTQTHTNSKTGEDITALISFLGERSGKSNFAKSLHTQFFAKGYLSDRQIACAEDMMGKALAATTVTAPAEQAGGTDIPEVAAGHYAIKSLTGNNDLDFFRVDRPTEGKWAGYTFVKRVIGGKADVRVPFKLALRVLALIQADTEAMGRYGQEIGRCGKCNRHLTDETSRSLGIGPECRKGL